MNQYYLSFDTETGALNTKEGDLLTAYFVILDADFKIVDEINLKLKPNGRLPIAQSTALAVNGINIQKHVEDPETLTYSEGTSKVITFLKKYSQKKGRQCNIRPMGYNILFDLRFIWEYLLTEKDWGDLVHYKRIDVMERVDFLKECQWLPSDLGSLGTVVDYFKLSKRNAHDAKDDTLMTVDVYKKLLEIMKSKKENSSQQDLISLLETE